MTLEKKKEDTNWHKTKYIKQDFITTTKTVG